MEPGMMAAKFQGDQFFGFIPLTALVCETRF